jgi:hypothetical protein
MVVFHPQKVTGGLPATLTPNAIYFVRVGAGFTIYASDATGSVAYPINQENGGGGGGGSEITSLATYEYLLAIGLG